MSSNDYNTLFDDDFEAWQYGPVVPSVYRAYSMYGGTPISKAAQYRTFDFFGNASTRITPLSGDELQSVTATVRKWAGLPSWRIVNYSHKKGGAWDLVFNKGGKPGCGLREKIPLDTIKKTLFLWES